MRSRIEIEEELDHLQHLISQIPPTSTFGDDNVLALRSQIEVIQERMGFDEVVETYEEDGSFVLAAVLDAERWLHDDAEPVSSEWYEMLAEAPSLTLVAISA